eukprot:1292642-Prymnesium_polylepis.1
MHQPPVQACVVQHQVGVGPEESVQLEPLDRGARRVEVVAVEEHEVERLKVDVRGFEPSRVLGDDDVAVAGAAGQLDLRNRIQVDSVHVPAPLGERRRQEGPRREAAEAAELEHALDVRRLHERVEEERLVVLHRADHILSRALVADVPRGQKVLAIEVDVGRAPRPVEDELGVRLHGAGGLVMSVHSPRL